MVESSVIGASFFDRDTVTVAHDLLGQHLCRQMPNGEIRRWHLTEVEAYDGPEDRACHACKGKTPRNTVMFGPPGIFYVYLCYGVHWMLNIVTGPVDYPAAVLIRGVGEVIGPGRVTKALAINREQNGQPAVTASGLWFEHGEDLTGLRIESTPRIGINYAPEPWLSVPYRFVWQR